CLPYSSVIMMACSGQDCAASRTRACRSAGTTSSIADELPSISLSWNESGAIIEHRVWPWHRSESTQTFTVSPSVIRCGSVVVVVPLEVAAGVDAQLHSGYVPGLVGGQPQDGVADVLRFDVGNLHRLLHAENRLGVRLCRVVEVRPERAVHR